jgi:hypothetical protein
MVCVPSLSLPLARLSPEPAIGNGPFDVQYFYDDDKHVVSKSLSILAPEAAAVETHFT